MNHPATHDSTIFSLSTVWNVLALVVAGVGSAGSVYLSVGMGLKACPLCFYQRSFILASASVLAILIWIDGVGSRRAGLVTLPLAWAGLAVAAYHVFLTLNGTLECPPSLLGLGDGPRQSLVVFVALTLLCLLSGWTSRRAGPRQGLVTIVGASILGFGIAWASIASAPPLPPAPPQPYDSAKQPFDTCRRPYQ